MGNGCVVIDWRYDMENAPRDGTELHLLRSDEEVETGFWCDCIPSLIYTAESKGGWTTGAEWDWFDIEAGEETSGIVEIEPAPTAWALINAPEGE